jgi:biopolymer transport protein ExbD
MFKRRKRHSVPGLNTASTADISFMLLIFFLITTSMDSDKGLGRRLPPLDPEEQQEIEKDIDKDKVLTIHLMANNKLTINDKEARISPELRKTVKQFIVNAGPKHIIELQVDRDADYDSYFKLQNQLVKSYSELEDYPQRIQEVSTN